MRAYSHHSLPPSEREVKYILLVAQLPDYARTPLSSFALWALSGYFSAKFPKSYGASEPSLEDLEGAVQTVVARCHSLDMLRHCSIDSFNMLTPKKKNVSSLRRVHGLGRDPAEFPCLFFRLLYATKWLSTSFSTSRACE